MDRVDETRDDCVGEKSRVSPFGYATEHVTYEEGIDSRTDLE